MNQSNQTKPRESREEQATLPYKTTEGKWLSVKLYTEELVAVVGIQLAFKKLGLSMSQSQIIRQFMTLGL